MFCFKYIRGSFCHKTGLETGSYYPDNSVSFNGRMGAAAKLFVTLYCCITWLHAGISQSITAEQFRLLVESRVRALGLVANDAYINITGEWA